MGRFEDDENDEEIEEKPGHGIFATTFLMIFLAEFGDKTQIAVAGMGSAADASATWVGATLALACTSLLGVFAGRRLLNHLPLKWIHRISGVFFLLLALLATLRLLGLVQAFTFLALVPSNSRACLSVMSVISTPPSMRAIS
eukprot:TRINITY_DN6317_c0_g1_i2.p1 TRINITY_DN6317_c0_g1~~TRINITY_DN6317_c0_g1_i2.p1  ORF type:complete len:142 (+),score=11.48 TRINITY_DN6317_c0_g1_i2:166-591(+)